MNTLTDSIRIVTNVIRIKDTDMNLFHIDPLQEDSEEIKLIYQDAYGRQHLQSAILSARIFPEHIQLFLDDDTDKFFKTIEQKLSKFYSIRSLGSHPVLCHHDDLEWLNDNIPPQEISLGDCIGNHQVRVIFRPLKLIKIIGNLHILNLKLSHLKLETKP